MSVMEQLKNDLMTFSTSSTTNSTLVSDTPALRKKKANAVPAYVLLILSCGIVLRIFSDRGYSSILTLGAGIQFFGFQMLLIKVQYSKSVAGISRRTLETYAMVLAVKLMSTLFRQGYLPVDRSGDFMYQLADILSLATVMRLINFMHTTYASTYQEEHDTLDVSRVFPICFLLAVFIHGDLNNSFIFDTIWTLHMNMDVVAMIPQLWMLSRIGEVEGMTSHFVAAMVASRGCSFSFWFYGFRELKRGNGMNLCGWQLIGAHCLQFLIAADFMFYYILAWIRMRKMVLPTRGAIEL